MKDNHQIDNRREKENTSVPVSIEISHDEAHKESNVHQGKVKDIKSENYLEQLQRLQAEFENYRKRVNRENESLFLRAKADLVLKLLPVVDDFERMIDHHQKDNQKIIDGIKLICQSLKKVLMNEGLEEIPAKGEPFDPEFHEAVSIEKTDNYCEGLVVEEWQKGYRFGGRLLRPSRVKVGRAVDDMGD